MEPLLDAFRDSAGSDKQKKQPRFWEVLICTTLSLSVMEKNLVSKEEMKTIKFFLIKSINYFHIYFSVCFVK